MSEPMGRVGAGRSVSLTWERLSIARLRVSGCHRTHGAQQRMWLMPGPVIACRLTCHALELCTGRRGVCPRRQDKMCLADLGGRNSRGVTVSMASRRN